MCAWVLSRLSYIRSFATPWNVACQTPQSIGFSRQEYWSGLPFPSPRDLPDPGIEPGSPASQRDSLLTQLSGFFTSEPPGKPLDSLYVPFSIAIMFKYSNEETLCHLKYEVGNSWIWLISH